MTQVEVTRRADVVNEALCDRLDTCTIDLSEHKRHIDECELWMREKLEAVAEQDENVTLLA